MTDGPRQRSSTAGSSKDAAGEESGGGVALKKEIGLVSACGIIVGKSSSWFLPELRLPCDLWRFSCHLSLRRVQSGEAGPGCRSPD